LAPTPGRFTHDGDAGDSSQRAFPTPESCRICGVLIAPPQRIISPARTERRPRRPAVLDADGPAALELTDVTCASVRTARCGAADRVQVRARRAEAATAPDVAVETREPLLPVPVDVVGARVTGLNGRREKRIEQRVRRRPALQDKRPALAAPLVRACEAGLHALEIRQAVRVVPGLHARVGGPALVVERVAALERSCR
jgi:hypothetical protein